MKTAISIPDDLFEEADRLAAHRGISRSELYATALREYLQGQRGLGVRERLDAVYALDRDATADPADAGGAAPEVARRHQGTRSRTRSRAGTSLASSAPASAQGNSAPSAPQSTSQSAPESAPPSNAASSPGSGPDSGLDQTLARLQRQVLTWER